MPSLRQSFMTQQPGYGYGPPPPMMGYPMGGYMPAYTPMPPQPMRYMPAPPQMYPDYGYASCGYGYENGYDIGYDQMPPQRPMNGGMGMRPRSSSMGARGQYNRYEDEDDFEYPSPRNYIRAADKEPARYEMPDLKSFRPKTKKSYDFAYDDLPQNYVPRNQKRSDGPEYKCTSTGTPLPISKADLLPACSIDEWEQRRAEDRRDRNVDLTLVPQMRRKARQVATQVSKYHPDFHQPRHFGDKHVSKLIIKHPDMNEEDILEHYVGKLQLELNDIGGKYDPCNDAPEIVFKEREKPAKVTHQRERLAITYPEDEYLNNMDNLGIRCLSHYKGTRSAAKTEVLNPRQFIRDSTQVLPETYASKYESSIPALAEPINENGISTDKKPFIPFYYGLTNRRIDTDEEKDLAINYTYDDRRSKALDIYDHEKKALTYEAEKPLDTVGSTFSKYNEPSARKPSKFTKKVEEPSMLDEQVTRITPKRQEETSTFEEPISQKSAFVTELKSKLSKVSPAKEIIPTVTSPKSVSEANRTPPSMTVDDFTSPTISFSEDPEKEKKRLEKKKRKESREAASKAAMESELAALAAAEAELQILEQEELKLKS